MKVMKRITIRTIVMEMMKTNINEKIIIINDGDIQYGDDDNAY